MCTFCASILGCARTETRKEASAGPATPDVENRADDPLRSRLLVELDVFSSLFAGEGIGDEVLSLVRKSYLEVGLEVSIDVQTIDGSFEALVTGERKSELLKGSRDNPKALHVIVAAHGAGAHAIVHYRNARSLDETGVLVYAETVSEEFQKNPLLAAAGLTVSQLLARSLAHEIGHAIGCGHDVRPGSASVMVQNSALGPVTADNMGRWRLALAGTSGHPEFDDSVRDCIDLTAVLSVDALQPRYAETNEVPSNNGRSRE